jgi:hypothetical protein
MKYTAGSYSFGHSWSLVERTHEPTGKKHANGRQKTLMHTFRMIKDETINEQRVSMGEKKQGQNSNRKISGG